MGIKTQYRVTLTYLANSEKPPHHMGIKTTLLRIQLFLDIPLKNLPTTWGLRRISMSTYGGRTNSEKPPHHMGIKT